MINTTQKYALLILVLFCVKVINCCKLPPNLWCSSEETAKECQVESQCATFVWSQPQPGASPVNFALYYESLCSDCKWFMKNQLWPTYTKVGSIMNITLVPYGNAFTCVIYTVRDQSLYMPFVACVEMDDDLPRSSAPSCASKYGIDYKLVEQCVNGSLGNSLEHEMAELTNKLRPPHTYVPWITLNGMHTEKIQTAATDDLLKLICDTYQGKKPEACQKHTPSYGCLRDKMNTKQATNQIWTLH